MVRMCFYYRRNNKYIDIVDELNIIQRKESIKDLVTFLQNHEKQRVNFCVQEPEQFFEDDIPEQLSTIENRKNLYIRFTKKANEPINESLQEEMKKYDLPFYYTEVAGDWDVLHGLIDQEVSDVYVGNNLGFELDKVAAVAKEAGIKIRVFPNVAQSAWNSADSLTKFFIRPEDLILYSRYVDCFEFYEISNSPLANAELLYEIYKFDKKWDGDLEAIIMFFRDSLDNRTLDEQWGYSRLKCGKNCVKGGPCRICHRLAEMSEKMSEKEKMMNRFLTKKLF